MVIKDRYKDFVEAYNQKLQVKNRDWRRMVANGEYIYFEGKDEALLEGAILSRIDQLDSKLRPVFDKCKKSSEQPEKKKTVEQPDQEAWLDSVRHLYGEEELGVNFDQSTWRFVDYIDEPVTFSELLALAWPKVANKRTLYHQLYKVYKETKHPVSSCSMEDLVNLYNEKLADASYDGWHSDIIPICFDATGRIEWPHTHTGNLGPAEDHTFCKTLSLDDLKPWVLESGNKNLKNLFYKLLSPATSTLDPVPVPAPATNPIPAPNTVPVPATNPTVSKENSSMKTPNINKLFSFFKTAAVEGAKDGASRVATDAMVSVARKYYEPYVPRFIRKLKFYRAMEDLLVPTGLFIAADVWGDKLPNASAIGAAARRSARTVFSDQSRIILGGIIQPMFKELAQNELLKSLSNVSE